LDEEIVVGSEVEEILGKRFYQQEKLFFESILFDYETWSRFKNGKISIKSHHYENQLNIFVQTFISHVLQKAHHKATFSRFLRTPRGYTLILKCSTTCNSSWHVKINVFEKEFTIQNEEHENRSINKSFKRNFLKKKTASQIKIFLAALRLSFFFDMLNSKIFTN
jgi:hypothetical protein